MYVNMGYWCAWAASQNLAKARGDGSQAVADPATLRLRGNRGDVLHRHLAVLIDEPARAPFGNYGDENKKWDELKGQKGSYGGR